MQGQCQSHDLAASLHLGTWRVAWSGSPVACTLVVPSQMWVIAHSDGRCQTTF